MSYISVVEAMTNALTFLEALGYSGGDVHDDLAKAISAVRNTNAAYLPVAVEQVKSGR